jgi:hypothetical protein
MMQMERIIQGKIFHLSKKKNRCVCLYFEVPIILGSIYLLEIHSIKDAISPIIELIFK